MKEVIDVLRINSEVKLNNGDILAKIIGILLEGIPNHTSYKVEYYDGRSRKTEWVEEYQFTLTERNIQKIGLI